MFFVVLVEVLIKEGFKYLSKYMAAEVVTNRDD